MSLVVSKASAPCKIIMFGEHFVVYGKPAIAAAINKRIYSKVNLRKDDVININNDIDSKDLYKFNIIIENILSNFKRIGLNIEIRTEVEFGSGLGTSAATIASLASAISNLFGRFDKKEIFDITLRCENIIHGRSSGIDPAVCINGGLILFKKDGGISIKELEVDNTLEFIIVYSGESRSSIDIINKVKRIKENYKGRFEELANESESITLDALIALKERDYVKLGSLMLKNHKLLSRLNVTTPTLDKLVELALKKGAFGAKLTGAGGGGSVIILSDKKEELLDSLRGYKLFVSHIEKDGVKIINDE